MFPGHVVEHLLCRLKVAMPCLESGVAARDRTGNQARLVPAKFLASCQISSRLERPQRHRHLHDLVLNIWQQLSSDAAIQTVHAVVTVRRA